MTRRSNGNGAYIATKSMNLSMRAMKLKYKGKPTSRPEISTRKEVGEIEAMLEEGSSEKPWWRNVGMEEGM